MLARQASPFLWVLARTFMRLKKILRTIFLLANFMALQQCGLENHEVKALLNRYRHLKQKEVKCLFWIENKAFYSTEAVFKGKVSLGTSSMRMDLSDAQKSNVIVSIMANDWYLKKDKPFQVNATQGTTDLMLLFGKLIDVKNQHGLGFLLMNGSCKILKFSQDLLLIKFEGQVAEYMKMHQEKEWKRMRGYVLIASPDYEYHELAPSAFFKAKE